ncbi:MAG: TlyA family RNA methyltransferase [Patescibacteria group bacterium]|jgi:23S rRNA (cytidine1920-2'-O)/16S rRNA (cytidine1409-2'-O)-methyltransferase|nr:TlyA family RNA methyltransferase [Patescibacteria group bacterium]
MDFINKVRLDQQLFNLGLARTRSNAKNLIMLGKVKVDGQIITKPGYVVWTNQKIDLVPQTLFLNRAAYKLESVIEKFKLDFKNKLVLDVGSSTGGFIDVALKQGANFVTGVELGKDQLHPQLRNNPKVKVFEKTDIRSLEKHNSKFGDIKLEYVPDIILIDVSFISVREIIQKIRYLSDKNTLVILMLKPQFETINISYKHKGVIKNEKIRRQIFKDFENWVQQYFFVLDKADSKVTGSKGNRERFYKLIPI